MARYKLTSTNGGELNVEKAEVDEENRVVRVIANSGDDKPYEYDYYPFESLISIIYLGED